MFFLQMLQLFPQLCPPELSNTPHHPDHHNLGLWIPTRGHWINPRHCEMIVQEGNNKMIYFWHNFHYVLLHLLSHTVSLSLQASTSYTVNPLSFNIHAMQSIRRCPRWTLLYFKGSRAKKVGNHRCGGYDLLMMSTVIFSSCVMELSLQY